VVDRVALGQVLLQSSVFPCQCQSTVNLHTWINNRPAGNRSSQSWSHPIEMNNERATEPVREGLRSIPNTLCYPTKTEVGSSSGSPLRPLTCHVRSCWFHSPSFQLHTYTHTYKHTHTHTHTHTQIYIPHLRIA
jgi:hypothetical protein